ncbi:MAG TPA: pyridoxamine 5'-phosphate oxidase family protein, partial [Candidatus Saccharimonadales bacterium]
LESHRVGVLATANESGEPHAAAVYMTYDDQLNIYFMTKKQTRKSQNLERNNHAAIVVYDADLQTTVQAEGTVGEVDNASLQMRVYEEIRQAAALTSLNTTPPIAQLMAGGYVTYRLVASSLRMATYSSPDTGMGQVEDIFTVVYPQPY